MKKEVEMIARSKRHCWKLINKAIDINNRAVYLSSCGIDATRKFKIAKLYLRRWENALIRLGLLELNNIGA